MAAATFTIDPDEFLGLSALAELDRAANGGGTGSGPDALSEAKALMRQALAGKLHDAGLPWAPSADAVRHRAAQVAPPASNVARLMASSKVRKNAAFVLAVVGLVALWGGYARRWEWTGFQTNGQVWDWLNLLLLPVVIATAPLWIKNKHYIGRARGIAHGAFVAAATGFVIAAYLVPLRWSGFQGHTLWDWFGLLLLPTAVGITIALTSMRVRLPMVARSLRPYQKAIMAALAVGWIVTVMGGYALNWTWTGYPQNGHLWDWISLLLAPLLFPTVLLPAMLKWILGNADERAKEAAMAPAATAVPSTDRRNTLNA